MALDLRKAMAVGDKLQIQENNNQCPSSECQNIMNSNESFAIMTDDTELSSTASTGYVFNNCNVTINNFKKWQLI